MRIGEIDVTPVSDGFFNMPPQYFGETADWGPHKELLGDDGNLRIPIGCFVVRSGGQTILVDAGLGELDLGEMGKGGELPAALGAAGVTPDNIDVVVCTHLHIDHAGWLVKDGAPFFPNATVRFGAGDWEQFVVKGEVPQTQADVKLLADMGRVEIIDGDDVLLAPGVTARHAPGHTHGHNVLVLASGDARAVLLGDAITCPVQLEEPDWQAMSDVDKDLATRTREALFRELEGTDTLAVAAHFPGLQFGRILPGEGKRYFSV